jgi:hypothetical protein
MGYCESRVTIRKSTLILQHSCMTTCCSRYPLCRIWISAHYSSVFLYESHVKCNLTNKSLMKVSRVRLLNRNIIHILVNKERMNTRTSTSSLNKERAG